MKIFTSYAFTCPHDLRLFINFVLSENAPTGFNDITIFGSGVPMVRFEGITGERKVNNAFFLNDNGIRYTQMPDVKRDDL